MDELPKQQPPMIRTETDTDTEITLNQNPVYDLTSAANIKMEKNQVYGLSQPTHTEADYDYIM